MKKVHVVHEERQRMLLPKKYANTTAPLYKYANVTIHNYGQNLNTHGVSFYRK